MTFQRGLHAAALLILLATGCAQPEGTDPDLVANYRESILLAEEPDGAMGVLDARESLIGVPADVASAEPTGDEDSLVTTEVSTTDGSATDLQQLALDSQKQMVVVGRIGGVPNPWKQAQPDYPWTAGQAQFMLADAAAAAEVEDHGHAHEDPDHDCPFCASAANSDAVAVVRFKDKNGKIIPISARELFDLAGQEMVVVRGTAQIHGDAKSGVLTLDADGLYVRR